MNVRGGRRRIRNGVVEVRGREVVRGRREGGKEKGRGRGGERESGE